MQKAQLSCQSGARVERAADQVRGEVAGLGGNSGRRLNARKKQQGREQMHSGLIFGPERPSRRRGSLGGRKLARLAARFGLKNKFGLQGKDLFMDLDEGALKLIDPENLTVLNTQPIHTIRVWGVGRDNGR